MKKFNIEKIIKIHNKGIKLAQKAFKQCNYNKSINIIDIIVRAAQHINWIYRDDELEKLMCDISAKILPEPNIENYNPINERWVFYDQIGRNGVLAEQYIRALISWDVDFLYITEPSIHRNLYSELLNEVKNYPKATVLILDDTTKPIKNIQKAYEAILDYQPQKALIHSPAEGACGVILWRALPQITRYRIVPGDHHFYIGVSVTDYAIEFREYGCQVAIEKRGFAQKQILCQPYYPIITKPKFSGFPSEITKDKVVIFSGGAPYKAYSSDNVFFNIVKQILDNNPNTVFLYAGATKNDKPFINFISKNGYESRMFLLGFRKDINAIFENCDIYLGTYPMCGGLMSQYAAINGKPIVQFNTSNYQCNEIEGILSHGNYGNIPITYYDMEEIMAYVKHLIENKDFRESEGAKLKTRVISCDEFNFDLKNLLENHQNKRAIKPMHINYNAFTDNYVERENKYTFYYRTSILKQSINSLFLYPFLFTDTLKNRSIFTKYVKHHLLNRPYKWLFKFESLREILIRAKNNINN